VNRSLIKAGCLCTSGLCATGKVNDRFKKNPNSVVFSLNFDKNGGDFYLIAPVQMNSLYLIQENFGKHTLLKTVIVHFQNAPPSGFLFKN